MRENPIRLAFNNMDPVIVPKEIQGLTFVEHLLIARVQPAPLYRVRLHGFLGQYAYKGDIINVGQTISAVVRLLPRTATNQSVIIVRQELLNQHRVFYVRRDKILVAFTFLTPNNPYYAHIDNLDTLQKINKSKAMIARRDELERLRNLANKT